VTDVTKLMNSYRECARNIWNAYFSAHPRWHELESQYDQLRQILFECLVLSRIGRDGIVNEPLLVEVVPISSCPVLIRRPSKDGNVYWDEQSDLLVGEADISLRFVDYYDFFQYPVRDFRFYRCKVLKFPRYNAYEGREALIDVANAKVLHTE
jgi:hypothetical protein